jgi:hypothetical protein
MRKCESRVCSAPCDEIYVSRARRGRDFGPGGVRSWFFRTGRMREPVRQHYLICRKESIASGFTSSGNACLGILWHLKKIIHVRAVLHQVARRGSFETEEVVSDDQYLNMGRRA